MKFGKRLKGFLGAPTTSPSSSPIPIPIPQKTNQPAAPSYPRGALTRAMNLARQAAEKHNGGLNYYRAESSMYGPATEAPFKDNQDGTLTFTFLGGDLPPNPPTIQSIVTVENRREMGHH